MSKISELSDGGVIQGGDTLIAVRSGGNVKVTYGGTTTANIDGGNIDGTTIGGTTPAAGNFTTGSFTGDVSFGDNDKAIFGAGSDLQIYSDGENSILKENGGGNLIINADNLNIVNSADTEFKAKFNTDGSVQLYYDNAEKLATTSTGIDVTGTVTADGLTVDGDVRLDGGASGSDRYLRFTEYFGSIQNAGFYLHLDGTDDDLYIGRHDTADTNVANDKVAIGIDRGTGDITFYDTDGTTSSFVYDASAGLTINEAGADRDFRVESDSNANMLFVDGGANHVNVGTAVAPQGGSLFHVRRNASCIEWGHGNSSAGYFGTLGAYGNTGHPYIGFSTEADTVNVDTFSTYGHKGSIIKGDTSGNLIFAQVTNADATLQTPINRLTVAPSEFIVNDASNDYDFRVESDSNTHMLFVNAGSNRVGVGEPLPGDTLQLNGGNIVNPNSTGSEITSATFGVGGNIHLEERQPDGAYSDRTDLVIVTNTGFGAGESEKLRLAASGAITTYPVANAETVFNESGVDADFRVESDGNTHALFVNAGAERVGLFTSSPQETLHLTTGAVTAARFDRSDTGGVYAKFRDSGTSSNQFAWYGADGDSAAIYSNNSQLLLKGTGSEAVFNDQGNDYDFRVESDSVDHMLFVDASGNRVIIGRNIGSATLEIYEATNKDEADAHFRITGSGYSGNHWLDGAAYYIGQNSTLRSLRFYSGAETAGAQLSNGSTSFTTFSDERLKYDVEPIENALDSLSGLRTVKYRLEGVDSPDDKKKLGVIAQDLVGVHDEVLDSMTRSGDDTEYMGVRYTELVPVLIKAMQEQTEIINDLRARVAQLESN